MRKGAMAIAAAIALGAATMTTGVMAAPHGGPGGGGGMGRGGPAMGGGVRGGPAFGGGGMAFNRPGFTGRPGFVGRPGFAFNRGFRGRRFGPGFGWWGGPLWAYTGTCWRLRHVWTPWGWRWRRIWVC
jgi:hypothetical protein